MQLARRVTFHRLAAVGLVILVLTSILTVSSLNARDNAVFETEVQEIAEASTDELVAVETQYRAELVTQQPTSVTVTVSGEDPPASSAMRDRIRAQTGVNAEVIVVADQTNSG